MADSAKPRQDFHDLMLLTNPSAHSNFQLMNMNNFYSAILPSRLLSNVCANRAMLPSRVRLNVHVQLLQCYIFNFQSAMLPTSFQSNMRTQLLQRYGSIRATHQMYIYSIRITYYVMVMYAMTYCMCFEKKWHEDGWVERWFDVVAFVLRKGFFISCGLLYQLWASLSVVFLHLQRNDEVLCSFQVPKQIWKKRAVVTFHSIDFC